MTPEEVKERFDAIDARLPGPFLDAGMPHFGEEFTGVERFHLGATNTFNSYSSAHQLMILFAVTDDPIVSELIELPDLDYEIEHFHTIDDLVQRMREKQILRDKKVLDLGCGPVPAFARTVRRLGATVYTADILLTRGLEYDTNVFSSEDRAIEESHHVAIDLNERTAYKKLERKIGGDLDFLTSALADLGGWFGFGTLYTTFHNNEKFIGLLKSDGVLSKTHGTDTYVANEQEFVALGV